MILQDYLHSLSGKRVTVIGAGLSNRPLIKLLIAAGLDLTVRDRSETLSMGDLGGTCDVAGVKFYLGPDYLKDIDADIIFRTPSFLPSQPALADAAARGTVVTSEMEVFLKLCPCPVVAVTGSDGKTTTATVIAKLMESAGKTVWLGGNIGHPLLEDTDKIGRGDVAVLELSSFQLHSMSCSPDVAVITNIAPNHLDIHKDYQDYIDAKKQIFLHQKEGARLVLNRDNAVTRSCAGESVGDVVWFSRRERPIHGAYLRADGTICINFDGTETPVLAASELAVPGMHNVENMMAAFAAVWGSVPVKAMADVAHSFTGVPHRLETVRVLRGVTYINDSIASSPDRTLAGLACFPDKVILIAGGKDKGIPFDSLGPAVCKHVKKLYLTGWTADKIKASVEAAQEYRPGSPEIYMIRDFEETVLSAAAGAEPGDTVLLSPACTSFDRFKNFEERGNAFRKIIEDME